MSSKFELVCGVSPCFIAPFNKAAPSSGTPSKSSAVSASTSDSGAPSISSSGSGSISSDCAIKYNFFKKENYY